MTQEPLSPPPAGKPPPLLLGAIAGAVFGLLSGAAFGNVLGYGIAGLLLGAVATAVIGSIRNPAVRRAPERADDAHRPSHEPRRRKSKKRRH
jgi:hypothetical protein